MTRRCLQTIALAVVFAGFAAQPGGAQPVPMVEDCIRFPDAPHCTPDNMVPLPEFMKPAAPTAPELPTRPAEIILFDVPLEFRGEAHTTQTISFSRALELHGETQQTREVTFPTLLEFHGE